MTLAQASNFVKKGSPKGYFMAEFCEKCFKENLMTSAEQRMVDAGKINLVLSDWDEFCEDCGQIGSVVIRVQKSE